MLSIRETVEMIGPLLAVEDLRVRFRTDSGEISAVNGVNFTVPAGATIGIVGESGSGKSQILMAIMGLLAQNGAATGSVKFKSREILGLAEHKLDRVRGREMAMIFQDPMASLNPYLRISTQLAEVLIKHRGIGKKLALEAAIAMLERVAIPDAARRIHLFPHEFSGGMRQRVMISMALLCEPALLFADEPTTALDVTVQAQILDLLKDLTSAIGTSIVLVTHDLGVVASICEQVIVLYGGRVMESGPVGAIFHDAKHPYTRGLIASIPRLDERIHIRLATIPGHPPSLALDSPGCPFMPRCPLADPAICMTRPIAQKTATRELACHKATL